MSRIRDRNTKPELIVRRGLHARGLRYRLQDRALPGRPDLVFPRYRTVIFVNGCFWHGHSCPMFRMPATRAEFWRTKIAANQERDARSYEALLDTGWRVLTIWECSLRGPNRWPRDAFLNTCRDFIVGNSQSAEISGRSTDQTP
ncbi:very short patch repair endonuclease [Lysobacter sp. cf310]|uniref:very short patch repair endonuclease n=1 Tax=Lysobacter sp. cf310 TaxID=1761790 RepID=UPI0008E158A8|nr:very short patch repair endonuclease [Lysobacter sp. cf310]SFL20343.1 T/G mismatch-specific endonuclease [Lysobacter sp. cf310]